MCVSVYGRRALSLHTIRCSVRCVSTARPVGNRWLVDLEFRRVIAGWREIMLYGNAVPLCLIYSDVIIDRDATLSIDSSPVYKK